MNSSGSAGAGGTSDLGEVVRLTLRLSRRFRRALDEPLLSELGLNVKELLVLAAVMDGAQTPGGVAARQSLPAPTVSRIVGKLVEMGLIVRAADPVDLRRFELHLTPEGERRRERVREVAERVVDEHFGHLPPERLAQARRALEDLHAALEGAGENAP